MSRKAVAIWEKNQAGVVASTYMPFVGDPLLQIGREDLDMDSFSQIKGWKLPEKRATVYVSCLGPNRPGVVADSLVVEQIGS